MKKGRKSCKSSVDIKKIIPWGLGASLFAPEEGIGVQCSQVPTASKISSFTLVSLFDMSGWAFGMSEMGSAVLYIISIIL